MRKFAGIVACLIMHGDFLVGQSDAVSPANNLAENPADRKEVDVSKNDKYADDVWRFLRDFDVELKVFENDGQDRSLGAAYGYDKSIAGNVSFENLSGYDLNLALKGNVAFDDKANPDDFLTSKLGVRLFGALGGASAEVSDSVDGALADIGDQIAEETDIDKIRELVRKRNALERLSGLSMAWVYGKVNFNGGLEANQRFTARNYTAGLRAVVDIKSWEDGDGLSQWSIFDFPFAVVRMLSGYDDKWRPRGSALPTFAAVLDYVNPDGMGPRVMVAGDTSEFWRFGSEVSFKTPLSYINKTPYYFNASYRYYHELEASAAVSSASLDNFDYWKLSVTTNDGLFISYRSGQLPFDVKDNDAFELGWKFNF